MGRESFKHYRAGIGVEEYAYGGYTKITANENFLVGLSSRVNIFSKFAYKR